MNSKRISLLLAIAVSSYALMGMSCGPSEPTCEGCPDTPGDVPGPVASEPPAFNGGFDDRSFPYTGSCACVDEDYNPNTAQTITCSPAQPTTVCSCRATGTGSNPATWTYDVACAAPTDPPHGWEVSPLDVFRSSRGHGGVFFSYGAGRNAGPPRPPGYNVPDGTALHLQLCYTTYDPSWCEGPIVVSSARFAVNPGGRYRLSMWLRSTIFMATGQPQENRTRLSVRFYDRSGVSIGTDGFPFEPNTAPLSEWTQGHADVTVPIGAVEARIEVGADRNRQSNVYIDDIGFTPI